MRPYLFRLRTKSEEEYMRNLEDMCFSEHAAQPPCKGGRRSPDAAPEPVLDNITPAAGDHREPMISPLMAFILLPFCSIYHIFFTTECTTGSWEMVGV
ncbi:hypothetical protein MHYP_G00150130 [Metynnis hypsauchen]